MSKERFIKFIYSEESSYLIINHPNAFLLLTLIAQRARRLEGLPDGLKIGQCYIGDFSQCGIDTERKYRTAKKVLEGRKHIEISETCRTRKKTTTGVTTVGTLVRLISSNVYDINKESNDDPNDDRATTERRPSDDEQERTRKNKIEKRTTTPTPSNVVVASFYSCLDELPISNDEKLSLMKFSEDRVKLSIEFVKSKKKPPDELTSYLIWHCKELKPPVSTKSSNQTEQQRFALKYNEFLSQNGHGEVAETNVDLILSKNYMKYFMNGKFTTISLLNPIDQVKKDIELSRQELQYARNEK